MIGRKKEINELEELYNSGRAELVAVYGRRRVGKTYLINEVFSNDITFKHTGLSPAEITGSGMLSAQLSSFYLSLKEYGLDDADKPSDWIEAFYLLRKLLTKKDDGTRQIVFIDEFPWMDTKRSGFITGFESFWNGWGSSRHNLMVIVCGSATSWMRDRLLNNYGGLYGRVTYEIYLSPFTLHETELFFKDRNVDLSRYDIAECYMAVGGIPYYLGYFRRQFSVAQNLDEMFFSPHAKLHDEFDRLFNSVFSNPERIKSIVMILSKRRLGLTRKEIADRLNTGNNGRLSEDLNAMISGGFAEKYLPFGYSGKQEHYRLIDPFCLFYIHFVKNKKVVSPNFWKENLSSGAVTAWRGLAFENLCFNHIAQIKTALSVTGVYSTQSAWSPRDDDGKDGAQIDLLIDRADNVVNLCEIKYCSDAFAADKSTYMDMIHRKSLVEQKVSKRKAVRNTLITTYGIKSNKYSSVFSNVITLEDLFLQ